MAIQVQTTQNVILNFRAAGVGARIFAYLLDWIFILIWIVLVISIMFSLRNTTEILVTIIYILFMIPVLFYDLLFEFFNKGQTFGKKILKIRVVNLDGTTPSFGSYLIRWLFRLVDFSITNGILAVLMVTLTDKSQRLGDLLAGTTVISLKPEKDSGELSIPDLDFHANYAVAYPDVLDKLNDRDITTIRSVLEDYRYNRDEHTIRFLSNKVKNATGYIYEGNDRAFLKKITDDYNYLSIQ